MTLSSFIALIWNYLGNVRDKDKYFVIGGYQLCIVFINSPKMFELCFRAPVHCIELCSRAPLH